MGDVSSGGAAKSTGTSTTTIVAVTGLIALAVAAWYFLGTARAGSGEEPPIRVKGGSIHLDLLLAGRTWEPTNTGSETKWRVSGFERNKDEYLVYIAPTDIASCPDPDATSHRIVKKRVKKIEFLYHSTTQNKDFWIKLNAAGNKTRVDSGELPLKVLPATPWRLENKVTDEGYIKEIHIGRGTLEKVCTFTSRADLESVVLVEDPEDPEP